MVFAALPLLASSYQFCRVDAKTDDHFFLGFPSYFNVVAFYAIVFEPGAGTLAAVLVVCSLLVFVPIRYVYPTRTIAFRRLSLTLTALWLVSYAVILLEMPEPDPLILGFSNPLPLLLLRPEPLPLGQDAGDTTLGAARSLSAKDATHPNRGTTTRHPEHT